MRVLHSAREGEEGLTSNVDVVHVGLRDLISDLLNQSQRELHVVGLTWLSVDVPSNNQISLVHFPLDLVEECRGFARIGSDHASLWHKGASNRSFLGMEASLMP